MLEQAPAGGATHSFLYDGRGSTRMLLDESGDVVVNATATHGDVRQIFLYDTYGNPIGFDPAAALTTLLYNGEQTDLATGLQYLRSRYYDLATGRFTQLDPFSGNLNDPRSLHRYAYTTGDPVLFGDPTGEFEGLVGLLSSMNISVNVRTKDAANGAQGMNTAHKVNKAIKIYQKALDLLDKFEDAYGYYQLIVKSKRC